MKKLLLLNFLFGLILLGCTNNKSVNDVLKAKSQLTIDECWVELLSPFEFNQNKVGNLVVHEFLKYRVGLIQIESLEVLLKSVKHGNQISIPSKDVMITPPPKTPNEARRQEYLGLYKQAYVKEEVTEEPCEGYKDCSYEVRQKLEGAGWQLAGDVLYYGNGVHRAVGAKPMETDVKEITYTMDCNCQPKDVKFK